jgi:hypothetical protein
MNREQLEEAGIDKSDFPREKICRHRDGDPDCDCHPDEDDEDETGEATMNEHIESEPSDEQLATELQDIESLPPQLTSEQITEQVLRRLEAYRGEVLADVTDAKAAQAIDKKRIEVKNARTLTTRICKKQREDAIKTQREWIAVEKGVVERLAPVEEHLEAEAFRHDAWLRAEAAKAEQARLLRIKRRIEQVVKLGAELEMEPVNTLNDEEWETYAANLEAVAQRRKEAQAKASRLTEAGDECSVEEAATLTDDQYAHRITVALKAKREREEAERIAAEEKAEKERRDAEAEAKRQEEAEARRKATEAENARMRAQAEADAEELRKLREEKAERERKERERIEAEEQAERERIAAEQKAEQDKRDAEAAEEKRKEDEKRRALQEAEDAKREAERKAEEERIAEEERKRLEALRPEKEKIATWARNVIETMPSTPEITNEILLRHMRETVDAVRTALLDLEEAVRTKG